MDDDREIDQAEIDNVREDCSRITVSSNFGGTILLNPAE